MANDILTYSIAREWLQGTVGGERFSTRAWSGGGRGQTDNMAQHGFESYDVFRKTQHSRGIRGGPLPPGIYLCRHRAHHPVFGECINLAQTLTAEIHVDSKGDVRLYDRDKFYIHGRGKLGSDGCIVPENPADRARLNRAIKNSSGTVMLKVTDVGFPMPAAVDRATRTA
jgi:hypothetical protein